MGNAESSIMVQELIRACKRVVKAKKTAENDKCYWLNEGIHMNRINKAFEKLKHAVDILENIIEKQEGV